MDKANGVQADQTVMLVGCQSRLAYPNPFRRVRYYDAERNKRLVVLTNNFLIPAKTVADIYRSRWQVELFFKWIKQQHLRIKSFFGTSPNAVKTKTILQILEVNLFEKIPISQLVEDTIDRENAYRDDNQLNLFT